MADIERPSLEVAKVPQQDGLRRIRVSYNLVPSASDDHTEHTVTEQIVVHGIDREDAPVDPEIEPLLCGSDSYVMADGAVARVFERDLSRYRLDVEQDWWSTAQDGSVRPIAEWADHLVAEIRLTVDDTLVAAATTAVLSGSWGALGRD